LGAIFVCESWVLVGEEGQKKFDLLPLTAASVCDRSLLSSKPEND